LGIFLTLQIPLLLVGFGVFHLFAGRVVYAEFVEGVYFFDATPRGWEGPPVISETNAVLFYWYVVLRWWAIFVAIVGVPVGVSLHYFGSKKRHEYE